MIKTFTTFKYYQTQKKAMFGIQFYPTPKNVVENYLLKDINPSRYFRKTVLDPSGGDGALLEPFTRGRWSSTDTISFEIDPNLQAILSSKGHKVVGNDFLTEPCPYSPDLIVMNPPFKDGDKHLLRAWEILKNGEIRCLINAETYLNPYSQTRKELKHIIDNNGTFEELGNVFKEARRKTNVNVGLVILKKTTDETLDFDFDTYQKSNFDFKEAIENGNELAIKDEFGNMELRYNIVIEQTLKTIDALQKLVTISGDDYHINWINSNHETITKAIESRNKNKAIQLITESSWQMLLSRSKFRDLLTSTVKEEFNRKFKTQSNLAFTKANMIKLFSLLFQNKGEIQKQCLLSTFDYLTKYHHDNREEVEGWKSNEHWIVKKNRFILPRIIEDTYSDMYRVTYDARSKLNDLDKVMNMITGQKMSTIKSIVDRVEIALENNEFKCESTHFYIKMFKKGTLHFKFKEERTWRMFNYFASEARGFPLKEGKNKNDNYKLLG